MSQLCYVASTPRAYGFREMDSVSSWATLVDSVWLTTWVLSSSAPTFTSTWRTTKETKAQWEAPLLPQARVVEHFHHRGRLTVEESFPISLLTIHLWALRCCLTSSKTTLLPWMFGLSEWFSSPYSSERSLPVTSRCIVSGTWNHTDMMLSLATCLSFVLHQRTSCMIHSASTLIIHSTKLTTKNFWQTELNQSKASATCTHSLKTMQARTMMEASTLKTLWSPLKALATVQCSKKVTQRSSPLSLWPHRLQKTTTPTRMQFKCPDSLVNSKRTHLTVRKLTFSLPKPWFLKERMS